MPENILVVGATGYIASKLIPLLINEGHSVRCLARAPEKLRRRKWHDQVEIVKADVNQAESLTAALEGITTAYYLVHNMSAGSNYAKLDVSAAENFGVAAKAAGVRRIVYLGGLANTKEEGLALHLASRIQTGDMLRRGGVPVIEFRVGVVVGAGSVSFEMIRFIAEQFPLMVGPLWLRHRSQPASVINVLQYLIEVIRIDLAENAIVDIGSQQVHSYIGIMERYAQLRGLRRWPLLLPLIPAHLMAFFISKLTPVEFAYALPLVEGLQNDSLIQFTQHQHLFAHIPLLEYDQAVKAALQETNLEEVERPWLETAKDDQVWFHSGLVVHFQRRVITGDGQSLLRTVQAKAVEIVTDIGISNVEAMFDGSSGVSVSGMLHGKGKVWLCWHLHHGNRGWTIEQTSALRPDGLPAFLWLYTQQGALRNRLSATLTDLISKTPW